MTRIQSLFSLLSTALIVFSGLWFGAHSGMLLLAKLGVSSLSPLDLYMGSLHNPYMHTTADTINYLLLGVDDTDNELPKLEAIWTVTLYPNNTSLELMGISPTSELHNAFRANNFSYIERLLSINSQSPVVGSILLDHADLVSFTDFLGGVRIGGQRRNGLDVLSYVREPVHQDERLLRQAATVQAILAEAIVQKHQLSLNQMLAQVKELSLSADQISSLEANLPRMRTENVRIQVTPPRELHMKGNT